MLAATLVGILAITGCAPAGSELVVSDARIRALLPGQSNTVAYCVIENHGSASVTLVGATSPAAAAMEIHESRREGDMYRMRRRAEVEIPAQDTVRFEPGGLHLMLFDVKEVGEQVEIELLTSEGRRLTAIFKRIAAGAE
jgi:copper(I)-binding protein